MSGLLSLLRSRKFWIGVAGIVGIVLVQFNVPEDQANAISAGIATLATAIIAGIAYEDGKEKE